MQKNKHKKKLPLMFRQFFNFFFDYRYTLSLKNTPTHN